MQSATQPVEADKIPFTVIAPADLVEQIDAEGRREERKRGPMVVILTREALKARRARRAKRP